MYFVNYFFSIYTLNGFNNAMTEIFLHLYTEFLHSICFVLFHRWHLLPLLSIFNGTLQLKVIDASIWWVDRKIGSVLNHQNQLIMNRNASLAALIHLLNNLLLFECEPPQNCPILVIPSFCNLYRVQHSETLIKCIYGDEKKRNQFI